MLGSNHMWYGMTKKDIVRGLIVFFGIGLFAVLIGLIGSYFEKTEPKNYWALLLLLAAIPGIWLALVSVLTITWLKVTDEQVEWYLWKNFRLLSCPIADITHIGRGLVSAFIIKTKKGTIRLLGLHVANRTELSNHLVSINPNIQRL